MKKQEIQKRILGDKKPKEASWNFLQCYYAIKGSIREAKDLDFFCKKHKLGSIIKMIEADNIEYETLIKNWYERSNPELEKIRTLFKSDKHFLNALKQANEDLKWQIKQLNKGTLNEESTDI